MKQSWITIRFSGVAVLLAGVGSAITGCTSEDVIKALLFWLALALGGGATEETTTGGGAAAPTKIVMYGAGKHNGDFATGFAAAGGFSAARIGADNFCSANKPAGLNAPNVHAFISLTATDFIGQPNVAGGMNANFAAPADVPIVGPGADPTVDKIADDWADLTDGSIAQSLHTVGVVASTQAWWSLTDGGNFGLSSDNCQSGASTSALGKAGSSINSASTSWVDLQTNSCISSLDVVCIAY